MADLSRRRALAVLGVVAGGVSIGLPAAHAAAGAAEPDNDVLSEAAVLRDPAIPAAGNRDGDVTIVEYFDYQCPYCRKIEPELQQVAQDDGHVRLVFKNWPILGGVSVYAARIALAASYQDKYVAAHEALIGLNSRLSEAKARDLLGEAGIDVARAMRDLDARASDIDAVLARNNDQAKAFGFRGTPSFIIGKFRVPGILTMAQFDQAIADARAAAKAKK